MSEYDRIRRQCVKKGEMWEDTDFTTTQTSIFYHQSPPFQFTWKRPKDLDTNPVFIREGTSVLDVVPGKLGDRWLVSTLACLYLSKGFFYRVVPADQAFEPSINASASGYCGAFRFRVWWCGEWVEVTVDDRLPTVNGRLVFAHCSNSAQYWPCLLEKAYAKLHGSYEALKYGSTLDGLADLTGGVTESLGVKLDASFHVRLLSRLLANTSIITVVAQTNANNKENNRNNDSNISDKNQQIDSSGRRLASGILLGINYKICSIEKVDTLNNENVSLMRLRCPFGISGESTSDWCRNCPNWNELVSNGERERLAPHQLAEGEFYLSFNDFVENFTQIECVHLDAETSRDEPTLQGKVPWTTRVYQGCWQRGVTAGGCRNNDETFHINPQLHLILSDADEIVISLNQHSVLEPKVVGFSVYPLPKLGSDVFNKAFFKKTKSLVNSQYTNSRQVSHRCQLEQGGYLIIPTTFETAHEGSFTLRVYSTQPIKLKLVDLSPCQVKPSIIRAPNTPVTDSKSVGQYEAVFLQLADEHRTVNAFELHELLEACLPNDYIKSCANIEVCRQVILVFDVSGLGRLKLSDFRDFMASLKQWQAAFKCHTKEKTGILRAERLRDSFFDVGFQVNNEVLSALILRHMRKDGTLRFGDFVSAVLHLTVAFGTFDKRDPLQNGSVKLTLTEWLKYALLC